MNTRAKLRKAIRRRHRQLRLGAFMGAPTPFFFGAGWHEFRANPPLKESDVVAFEQQWKIELPSPYREYLLEVGNGFPGPYYGMGLLAEWCAPQFPEDEPADRLTKPFDPEADGARPLPGVLRIGNLGCEHYHVLVVSGPRRGEIWHDPTIDGLEPRRLETPDGSAMTLDAWIERWIDAVFNLDWMGSIDPCWLHWSFPGHSVHQLLADAPLSGIATDQLPCPACMLAVLQLHPRPRVVVVADKHAHLSNPKLAAERAAQANESSLTRPHVILGGEF